ncbi:DUF4345 domain-containing protein [uncultured Arthrobacter sp.]|uniref:DUF4345 domain-containing protein n=1 Tax=uncultured Arthrobacter sp. TaxID=114050 RepID=UPI0026319D49|nr:DUF4345 domain-containing protein [uncultured Arthrobacter sp.]
MNSSTPDNAQPGRRSSSIDAGQDAAGAASGSAGATGASGKPAAKQPSSGGTTAKTSKKESSKPAKTGNDWSVFRTVVVLVGLVIAGFGGYYLITGTAGLPETGDGPVNPTLENQFRFFAAMMIGVGAAFVTIAIKFQWANMLWLVCLMVFIGGIGRVLSWAFSGTPHFLLIILMVVELAFPAALLVWHRYIAKTSELRREYAARP